MFRERGVGDAVDVDRPSAALGKLAAVGRAGLDRSIAFVVADSSATQIAARRLPCHLGGGNFLLDHLHVRLAERTPRTDTRVDGLVALSGILRAAVRWAFATGGACVADAFPVGSGLRLGRP